MRLCTKLGPSCRSSGHQPSRPTSARLHPGLKPEKWKLWSHVDLAARLYLHCLDRSQTLKVSKPQLLPRQIGFVTSMKPIPILHNKAFGTFLSSIHFLSRLPCQAFLAMMLPLLKDTIPCSQSVSDPRWESWAGLSKPLGKPGETFALARLPKKKKLKCRSGEEKQYVYAHSRPWV